MPKLTGMAMAIAMTEVTSVPKIGTSGAEVLLHRIPVRR